MVSLQYNGGPVLTAPPNSQSYEWSFREDGTLHELEQKLEIDTGRHRREVTARFDARRNETIIEQEEPKPEKRLIKSGLVLLQTTTHNGALAIEF